MKILLLSLVLGMTAHVASAAEITREVKVLEDGVLNPYVGTQFGQTLYTFDMDTATQAACAGKCAEQWPPLLVTAAQAAELVAPFATITRINGLLQVTRKGSPLYTYSVDHAEGDDNGNGVGGVWHDIDF